MMIIFFKKGHMMKFHLISNDTYKYKNIFKNIFKNHKTPKYKYKPRNLKDSRGLQVTRKIKNKFWKTPSNFRF